MCCWVLAFRCIFCVTKCRLLIHRPKVLLGIQKPCGCPVSLRFGPYLRLKKSNISKYNWLSACRHCFGIICAYLCRRNYFLGLKWGDFYSTLVVFACIIRVLHQYGLCHGVKKVFAFCHIEIENLMPSPSASNYLDRAC